MACLLHFGPEFLADPMQMHRDGSATTPHGGGDFCRAAIVGIAKFEKALLGFGESGETLRKDS